MKFYLAQLPCRPRIAITTLIVLIVMLQSVGYSMINFMGNNVPVFTNGQEGYVCFRIPATIQLPNDDILAFAEGRKNGCSDTGDIDLVMKRSSDGGKTWSALTVLLDDEENTFGNPAPVFDHTTQTIHLLSTWNLGEDKESEIIDGTSKDTRRIYTMNSQDMGKTWNGPTEITNSVKLDGWTWYATGPGSGIQLIKPLYKDRLVVACDHIEAVTKKYYSHIIYSDDHGKSWKLGGSSPRDQVNECEVAELTDGSLLLNMRNYDRSKRNRQIAFSSDGGVTWEGQRHDDSLIEPICQASLQSYNFDNHKLLLFSNPADRKERINMTLRWSKDQGKTWPNEFIIHHGPSAYSDLVVLQNGSVGCLYEGGVEHPYEQIIFQLIPSEHFLNGQ